MQNDFGAHPASYRALFRLERKAEKSLLFRAEGKNDWWFTYSPSTLRQGVERDKFTL